MFAVWRKLNAYICYPTQIYSNVTFANDEIRGNIYEIETIIEFVNSVTHNRLFKRNQSIIVG